MIALYALVIKQLRRIAADGKVHRATHRLTDLAAFPDDTDQSLASTSCVQL